MNPIPIRLVPTLFGDDRQPGDAKYYAEYGGDDQHAGLNFRCPKCGELGTIAFKQSNGPKHAVWTWNGNVEKPTARASILHSADDCGWHGWLTDGVFHE